MPTPPIANATQLERSGLGQIAENGAGMARCFPPLSSALGLLGTAVTSPP